MLPCCENELLLWEREYTCISLFFHQRVTKDLCTKKVHKHSGGFKGGHRNTFCHTFTINFFLKNTYMNHRLILALYRQMGKPHANFPIWFYKAEAVKNTTLTTQYICITLFYASLLSFYISHLLSFKQKKMTRVIKMQTQLTHVHLHTLLPRSPDSWTREHLSTLNL